jgi:hypothetical protein
MAGDLCELLPGVTGFGLDGTRARQERASRWGWYHTGRRPVDQLSAQLDLKRPDALRERGL